MSVNPSLPMAAADDLGGALTTLAQAHDEFENRLVQIQQRIEELERIDHQVDTEAVKLELIIRTVAQTPQELFRRKPVLENAARAIGVRRWNIIHERNRLQQERDQLEARVQDSTTDSEPAVPLTAVVTMDSDHNFYAGLDGNIDQGGLFVATLQDIPVGTPVELTVDLPESSAIRVNGKVDWVREGHDFNSDFFPGVGVEFSDLGKLAREAFERFASYRFPILYEPAE